MDLKDTIAFISGGASGLGEAAARRFVAAGGRVMLVDLDAAQGEALAEELGEAAQFVAADVTSEAEISAAVEATQEAFGTIHVVINGAGIGLAMRTYGRGGVHPLEVFERVVGVNLVGSFNVIRLCVPVIMQNNPDADGERGVIINLASVAAYEGQIGQVAYAASKGGVVGDDPADGARSGAECDPRADRGAGALRYADAGRFAGCRAAIAGAAGAESAAAGRAGGIRAYGAIHRGSELSEWRGAAPGWRDADGAAVGGGGVS